MILFVRADSPEVSIELMQDGRTMASKQWQAGRELSLQIHRVIEDLCLQAEATVKDITGIVVYEGPGSYTGLRISIAVVNALGYSLDISVLGATGDNWKQLGSEKLEKSSGFTPLAPVYGGQVYTTQPKK